MQELEYVPLAISQAGAYILQKQPLMTIPVYLAEFRKSRENQPTLLNTSNADLRRDSRVPNAVITSWKLSFDHNRRTFPQAADLLPLMSCLNRQAIPQFLIQSNIDTLVFSEAIAMLLNSSLIRAEIRQQNFEMHRLVRIATRHWLEREPLGQKWKDCAIERLT